MTRKPSPARHRGFTLIEMLVAAGVAAVLSGIAYPSFQSTVHKVRRSDALVAMMQMQAAQERWRFSNGAYGSLAEVRMPAVTPAGHYALEVPVRNAAGYEVVATAQGGQGRDTACRVLKLTVSGLNVAQASGPDVDVTNSAEANRRCWGL